MFLIPQALAATATRCPVGSLLRCDGIAGITAVPALLEGGLIDIFYGLLALMLLVYAITLIVGSTNEGTIDEVRKAFTLALIASGLVFFRGSILSVVAPGGPLINPNGINPLLAAGLQFIKIVAAAGAGGLLVVRAIQLITAGGDEGQVSSQRKLLLNAAVGVGIIVLAGTIVNAALGGEGLQSEAVGIAEYVLYVLGALMVLSIVVGGILMIVSYDEGLQERAKKSIFAAVIVLITILCLGALIHLL